MIARLLAAFAGAARGGGVCLLGVMALATLARWPLAACASDGPENLFLVVNSASFSSLAVANQFIELRKIPPNNVYYIDWTGGTEGVDVETFRTKILLPALTTAEKRLLLGQIDYLVYSSDFPTAVNVAGDFARAAKFPAHASPTCSINSATYLWNLLVTKTPITMEPRINQYMRTFSKPGSGPDALTRSVDIPTHSFRSWYGWGMGGTLREAGGQPYLLSTMLAVTSGRGNSVSEALVCLRRSAAADGTAPKGTIYFTNTSDVRSTTRQPEVAKAIADLKQLGVAAEVVSTDMPEGKRDVAGLIAGSRAFNWAQTRSQILPGAICDNFTSFGGVMAEDASQTPLTEFIRFGAAGAAGTVIEPYALAEKFASPNIFVHYAQGCTLAEAYYQSLFGPAQVLIVGDPLCRPWADIPEVRAAGVKAGDKVSGTLVLRPQARTKKGGQIHHFELFVDGRRAGAAVPGEPLSWDSTTDCDGYHELRIVAECEGPIETQGRMIVPVTVDNNGRTATLTTTPAGRVLWSDKLQISVKAPGARLIHVLNNGRLLGSVRAAEGVVNINPRVLGFGPVQLQAIAAAGSTLKERVIPTPVQLMVEPAAPLPTLANPSQRLLPGLALKLPAGPPVAVQSTRDPAWLSTAGLGANQAFSFQGFFDVPADDIYQFQLWHYGDATLTVDGTPLYTGTKGQYVQRFIPVGLSKGLHNVTVSGKTSSDTKCRILFGGPGAQSLDGTRFKHTAAK